MIVHTGSRNPRDKVVCISFPTDEIVENAFPVPPGQELIFLVGGTLHDAHAIQFLSIKMLFIHRRVQIFQDIYGAALSADHLDKFEFLIGIIMFRNFREFHFFFTDSNMLAHTKVISSYTDAKTLIVHSCPYIEYMRIIQTGRRIASLTAHSVIVCLLEQW